MPTGSPRLSTDEVQSIDAVAVSNGELPQRRVTLDSDQNLALSS
jgi:hypothetical protein